MHTRTTLLVVDDQPLYLEGIESLLARAAPHVRCATLRRPEQALEHVAASDTPALVIADHSLGGRARGLALLERIGAARPQLARALMSAGEDAGLCLQARRAGLNGYLTKRMDAERWLDAIDALLAGRRYFAVPAAVPAALNERQLSVLQLASAGLGNRQIAERLHLTERTVKYHLKESFVRLSSSTRTEAVAKAAALGLIALPDHQATLA